MDPVVQLMTLMCLSDRECHKKYNDCIFGRFKRQNDYSQVQQMFINPISLVSDKPGTDLHQIGNLN